MGNPAFEEGSLARRIRPGDDLTGKDTLDPSAPCLVHRTTPPSLADGDAVQSQADDLGNLKVSLGDPAQLAMLNPGFSIPPCTEIHISYSGNNISEVVYKNGASVVATLTISYDANKIVSIVKT